MQEASQNPQPLEINLPADYRHQRLVLAPTPVIVLSALTMLMLSAIQEPIGYSHLAWIALAPWVIAAVGSQRSGRGALVSFLWGLLYFLVNIYWIAPVTIPGYVALCFYLAWYFVLTGYILRRVYLHRRWPFTFVLPIVWVAQEYLRATIMTGFAWLFLSHSQHENIRLMQTCDIFGAYGITFLIAMTNGLLCDLLLRPLVRSKKRKHQPRLTAAYLILATIYCIAGSLLYGHYRIKQGQKTITSGSPIAVIQEAIPQYVKESGQSDEEIFSKHLNLTKQALNAPVKPRLIVWPETMVLAPLNDSFLRLPAESLTDAGRSLQTQSLSYHNRLRELSTRQVSLLIGAAALDMDWQQEHMLQYNSAFLYLPDGKSAPQRYDKMHLVPFGEAVPFKKSWPWLHRLLNRLTPYDYEYTLDAGTELTVFEIPAGRFGKSRFAVAICYEDVMPYVPRRLAAVQDGKKRVDYLLNISNDGWFVRGGKNRPIKPSTELIQHLVICKFRAVENRIGIVRAVNTGISAFIRPDGSIQTKPLAGTLVPEPTKRQAAVGFLTDNVYLDTRTSIYSKIGDTFAITCTIFASLLLLDGLYLQFRNRKKT